MVDWRKAERSYPPLRSKNPATWPASEVLDLRKQRVGIRDNHANRSRNNRARFYRNVLLAEFDAGLSAKSGFDAIGGGVDFLGGERALEAAEGK